MQTENGCNTDDEINLVLPGFNSGWREVISFSNMERGFNEGKKLGRLWRKGHIQRARICVERCDRS